MKLRNVEWHNKTRHLIQDSSDGLEYAFVTKDYRQVHQLVWCKDFLNDVIYGFLNNKRASIWGFSYDPQKHMPIDLECTRLLLTSKRDWDFRKNILKSLAFINAIEKELQMTPTKIEECYEPPRHYRRSGVFIFSGSKRWMKAPPMISLYTLLIRVGLGHDVNQPWFQTMDDIRSGFMEPYYEEDLGILLNGQAGIERILKYGDRRLFHRDIRKNYPRWVGTDTIHNDCGIVGFSSDMTADYCPHWHRLET